MSSVNEHINNPKNSDSVDNNSTEFATLEQAETFYTNIVAKYSANPSWTYQDETAYTTTYTSGIHTAVVTLVP